MNKLDECLKENVISTLKENESIWVAPQMQKFNILSDTAGGPEAQPESNNGTVFGSP